jgi:hypothetical protein
MNLILTVALGGAALIAAAAVAIWGFMLISLRRDSRVIRDAEELKSVDLSSVIAAHVPLARRTNDPAEEIRLAKESMGRRLRSTRMTLSGSAAALLVLAGANVWLHARHEGPVFLGTRGTSVGVAPPTVDALKAVAGTWGWKYNALLSCKENPHTITLSGDRQHVTLRFRSPLPTRSGNVQGYDYDVVGAKPSELDLSLTDSPVRQDSMGHPLAWAMHFEDANSYYLKRSDVVTKDTGVIVRCPG